MNSEQFKSYLINPELLDQNSIEELTALVNDFPYFQSARILLTINLFKEKDVKYNSVLKETAVYAGSRNILKKHIDRAGREKVLINFKEEKISEKESAEEPKQDSEPQPKEQSEINISEEKVETPVKETKKSGETSEEDTIAQLKKIIENRIREIEKNKKEKDNPPATDKKKKFEIIDEFILKEPTISRPKAKFYDPIEHAKQSIVDQEEIISETLAKIYFDQGYFSKSIEMYKKLILKYPEKSSYFAALIEKANNELNKNQ